MNKYIKSDLFRYYGKTNFGCFIKCFIVNSAFRFQCVFRMITRGNRFEKAIGWCGWILIYKWSKRYQIPLSAKIGYGLYIGHHGPVIISENAIIGNNCNLSQNLTIGSNEGNIASIGNCVYIGPNVCIVERVSIGDYVTIGAGSVVTKDLPENSTCAGNYAIVLNFKEPGRYIYNRWTKNSDE